VCSATGVSLEESAGNIVFKLVSAMCRKETAVSRIWDENHRQTFRICLWLLGTILPLFQFPKNKITFD
jgi:hypothetical protein